MPGQQEASLVLIRRSTRAVRAGSGDRGGQAEVEALAEVDALSAEKVPGRFVFDALGDRL